MPETYPNQREITVHKAPLRNNYLGINKEVFSNACKTLTAHELKLYLYLSANMNNYKFALSQVAVTEFTGMARSTFYDQVHNLINKGYLVHRGGNQYDFYEDPYAILERSVVRDAEDTTVPSNGFDFTTLGLNSPSEDGEIYNRRDNPTDKINNYHPYTSNNSSKFIF